MEDKTFRDDFKCENCGETINAQGPLMAKHPADECPSGEAGRFVRVHE